MSSEPSKLRGFALTAWCVVAIASTCGAQEALQVSTDFEGGSATILSVDNPSATIRFSPGGDADRGWVCWWALRVDNVQNGQEIQFVLSPSNQKTRNNGRLSDKALDASWCMPNRAAVSSDGFSWLQSEPGKRADGQMVYKVVATGPSLWLAWGPLFTPRDSQLLFDEAVKKIPFTEQFQLAQTRENRSVLALRMCSTEVKSPPAIWIQARQHAWESGSSWVCRGFVDWLSEQSETARWLVDNVELVIVPIMDVDNVTTGNGGKEANPRDHNRDWDSTPVYPEVVAAQRQLLGWSLEQRLDLFVDLHNPAPGDAKPFFFCGPPELLSDVGRNNRALFLGLAQKYINGPLPIEPSPRLTGPSYHPLWKQISGQWVNEHGNSHTNAICLETSWNTPNSNVDGYRQVGKQLGETIAEYMQRRQRAP
jgi:hypothetical protein